MTAASSQAGGTQVANLSDLAGFFSPTAPSQGDASSQVSASVSAARAPRKGPGSVGESVGSDAHTSDNMGSGPGWVKHIPIANWRNPLHSVPKPKKKEGFGLGIIDEVRALRNQVQQQAAMLQQQAAVMEHHTATIAQQAATIARLEQAVWHNGPPGAVGSTEEPGPGTPTIEEPPPPSPKKKAGSGNPSASLSGGMSAVANLPKFRFRRPGGTRKSTMSSLASEE